MVIIVYITLVCVLYEYTENLGYKITITEYFYSRDPFTATIKCSRWYKMGEEITCQFSITNNHPVDYHVLKWFTPLEGLEYAYVSITKDGNVLPYDGVMIKRGRPGATEYQLLRAGHTITTKIDLSVAYAIEEVGQYTVQMQTQLYYRREALGAASSADIKQTLESTMSSTFQVLEGESPRKTLGQIHRQKATITQEAGTQQSGNPRNPKFTKGTAAERALTKEIHRASYHYISAAGDDISDNRGHYVSWFGALNAGRIRKVKQVFQGMKNALETDIITYIFDDPRCKPDVYAFTYKDSRKIYLCDAYVRSANILGIDTKLCTIVHELSHAVMSTDDNGYGRLTCLNLAKSNPNEAINNGDSYCYFAETTNIFNYGFDAMARLPNRRTYVTRGNTYIRYSDRSASTIDSGYPKLIKGYWGNLPDIFVAGFDSMTTLRNGKTYVTKGRQYVRYSDSSASRVDPGYPLPLQGNWGRLPASFAAGFDSMTVLRNEKTYVTKGSQYIRYSDRSASTVDRGYPKPLQRYWGTLPASFADSFDSMALLGNGKTYVTKNKQYIRYSDSSASRVDPGYPLPIKGNWGTIKFPGPQKRSFTDLYT